MLEFINLVAPELVLTGLPLLGGLLRVILRTGLLLTSWDTRR
ncbi:hypothetical protein SAMD00079811_34930 [Scytonema sp. HK-05]|nr:hypothetical protein [Scytonema sp. HK-05]BAY45886.1 hypothetical protein SAMD00079811_34930 [Scytonema sp. HK-05]